MILEGPTSWRLLDIGDILAHFPGLLMQLIYTTDNWRANYPDIQQGTSFSSDAETTTDWVTDQRDPSASRRRRFSFKVLLVVFQALRRRLKILTFSDNQAALNTQVPLNHWSLVWKCKKYLWWLFQHNKVDYWVDAVSFMLAGIRLVTKLLICWPKMVHTLHSSLIQYLILVFSCE